MAWETDPDGVRVLVLYPLDGSLPVVRIRPTAPGVYHLPAGQFLLPQLLQESVTLIGAGLDKTILCGTG